MIEPGQPALPFVEPRLNIPEGRSRLRMGIRSTARDDCNPTVESVANGTGGPAV